MIKALFAAFALFAILPAAAFAQPADVAAPSSADAPSPWDARFAAFAAADRAAPPPAGAVLFVGSSSIRMWSGLETQFGERQIVLNRGFGGSQLSDCVKYLQRLVIRYQPRTVLVYAGDNDLAAGSTPEQVLARFTAFVQGVHRALPDTRIDFISIKPSPLRAALTPAIRAANGLIRDYVATQPDLVYIDVYTPMLDAAGNPRRELFRDDSLHLNSDGYALWKKVITPYVLQAAN
ncbi:MAG: SGNH/GDSL hydrolase family protein [Casimicrobiaceae bacterium]